VSIELTNDIGLCSIISSGAGFSFGTKIDSVTPSLFNDCSNLYSISIPNALSIAKGALSDCISLMSLTLPGINYSDSNSIFGEQNKSNYENLNTISICNGTTDIDIGT
jgi:hypothetical protein